MITPLLKVRLFCNQGMVRGRVCTSKGKYFEFYRFLHKICNKKEHLEFRIYQHSEKIQCFRDFLIKLKNNDRKN